MSLIKSSVGAGFDIAMAISDSPVVVKVGSKLNKFVPNINISKWDDEAWLNINHPDIAQGNEVVEHIGNSVNITIGNKKHNYYPIDTDNFEYEIIYASRPISDIETFNLKFSNGLEFIYQRFLTPALIAAGIQSADNVQGSYAVYWNKKNNKYKTGKFCHIYRPELIDALGNRAWCDISIDAATKTLVVTMPTTWLDTATYPVILDPVFGYTTQGAGFAIGNTNQCWATILLADRFGGATSGEITKFTMYGKTSVGTSNFKAIAYTVNANLPSVRVGASSAAVLTTTPGWRDTGVVSTILEQGTAYVIAVGERTGNDAIIGFDFNASPSTSIMASNTFLDPWNHNSYFFDGEELAYVRLSVYATYNITVSEVGANNLFFCNG